MFQKQFKDLKELPEGIKWVRSNTFPRQADDTFITLTKGPLQAILTLADVQSDAFEEILLWEIDLLRFPADDWEVARFRLQNFENELTEYTFTYDEQPEIVGHKTPLGKISNGVQQFELTVGNMRSLLLEDITNYFKR